MENKIAATQPSCRILHHLESNHGEINILFITSVFIAVKELIRIISTVLKMDSMIVNIDLKYN